MKHLSIILTSIILVAQMFSASAQTPSKSRIAALCKPGKNHIELRWAPLNYELWQHGNATGYTIERVTILRKGKLVEPAERTVITEKPVTLAPISEWEKHEDDKYAMIAGECIFGESEIEDTGFLPIKAYKKRQDEERRIGFALFSADMSITAARLSGLYYKDTNVKPDEKYLYNIYLAQYDSAFTDTAYVFTGIAEYRPITAPPAPYFYCNKKAIVVWWQHSQIEKFNSYYVERSDDNGKTFHRITESPVVVSMQVRSDKTFYADTLVENSGNYQYRIIGIDSFGEESPASQPVKTKKVVPLEKDPNFTSVETVNNNSVVLTWTYDTDADVTGYKIYRSKSSAGSKTLVFTGNDPMQRSFTDKSPLYDNYYFLSVFNNTTERINPFPMYAQLIDSIPPAPPAPPSGYCDSLGLVHLSWHPHPDPDVIGYRLQRSNSQDDNYIMYARNMIADTFYVDTINLNTLSKYVYYKLSAVDGRDNQSKLSAPAAVARYDSIAPVAPEIDNLLYQRGKVVVSFIPSPSNDVQKYLIFRKKPNDAQFDTLASVAATADSYTDQTALPGQKYHYAIQAVDNFGLASAMAKKSFSVPQSKEETVQLKKKIDGNMLTLSWTSSINKQPGYVIVYRKVNDKPLQTYSQINDKGSFTDSGLVLGSSYLYCVRLVFSDGTESPLSNEIKFEM
ncbi:MAG: hypothetical protein PUC50_05655 [Bacteroidales bacterium]|nr:hypothetical protein [Bacteroidales bacterium]